MDYQLIVVRGRSASKLLKLADGITTVGRQQDCQLRIASSQVSRRHCQLYEKEGELVVMDLGSSNGTFVNGKKIEMLTVLKPGDVLALGSVKFRVDQIGAATPAAAHAKPGDTAVAEAVLGLDDEGDEEEFEIDFDEEETQTTSAVAVDAKSSPAAGQKPAKQPPANAEPPVKADTNPPAEPATELADEAVADFLLNIDLDDEDKR